MITAIVLINAARQCIPATAEALLAIPEVKEVYSVTGEYDLIAIVRVKEYDALAEVVTSRFAALTDITATRTMTAFQCYSRQDLEAIWSIGLDLPIGRSPPGSWGSSHN